MPHCSRGVKRSLRFYAKNDQFVKSIKGSGYLGHDALKIKYAPMFHKLVVSQAKNINDIHNYFFVGGGYAHEFTGVCCVKRLARSYFIAFGDLVIYLYAQVGKSGFQKVVEKVEYPFRPF